MDEKKRKKAFYRKSANKKGNSSYRSLSVGMRGFLLTCNNREKECVREAYNILNQYVEKVQPQEQSTNEGDGESDGTDEEQDIESAIKQGVADLKTNTTSQYKFYNVNSGAKNCVFIKSDFRNPVEIVHSIMQQCVDTDSVKARFICRFLPVSETCPARPDSILKAVEKMYDSFCEESGCHEYSFCVMPKIRNQNTMSSQSLKCDISGMIKDKHCLNRVDYSNPQIVILLEIICSVCCISIVKDFFKFRKYNLSELLIHGCAETENKNASQQEVTKCDSEGDTSSLKRKATDDDESCDQVDETKVMKLDALEEQCSTSDVKI